jgi:hypothetical protein
MANIEELMREYANTPMRVMRAASVSTDGQGGFFSYGLKIAQFRNEGCMFYILHEPDTTQTTKIHLSKLWWHLSKHVWSEHIRFVPWLTANEEEITNYFAAKLARVEQRFSRSRNLGTAREYYSLHFAYSRDAHNLPPIPANILTLAALEGWEV